MALYEGIALIQEKQAVVLDLGADYTKFGFTGEAAPRCIVRSEFWCAADRRYKKVYDYSTPEELYDNLVHMLHLLYFRHVLVNPKERKVIVVESLLTPTLFRETLAKVLFTHYEACLNLILILPKHIDITYYVSGAVWADSARACAAVLGTTHALVVSVGARETEVTAVVHSCVVLQALQSQPLAARAVHLELARLLDEDNGTELNLPDHVIEDIKVKTCFVTTRERSEQWSSDNKPSPAKDVQYPMPHRAAITVSGRTRELAAEVLFAKDNEFTSLPDIVLQCIMQCPIDARKALAANILVSGGGASLTGLKSRLAHELRHLVTQHPYNTRLYVREFKFHSAPAHDNACAWVGAALCGVGDAGAGAAAGAGMGVGVGAGAAAGGGRALAREQYARDGRLRDWVCLLDNTPPHHPHRDYLDI